MIEEEDYRKEETEETLVFLNEWVSSLELKGTKDKEKIIQSLRTLEEISNVSNDMFIFYETKTFKPLYVSKNIKDHFGYAPQEFIDLGIEAFKRIGVFEQGEFWADLKKWLADFLAFQAAGSGPVELKNYYIGRIYRTKSGQLKKYLAHTENVFEEKFELPTYVSLRFTDITHLMKGDDYMVYFQKPVNDKIVSKLYSKKNQTENALSNREMEILKLIAVGMSSKEIAAKLLISVDTVSQHRKNAIKRFSVRDTSSLIQLCKLCQIF